jgi:hypothetical protein
VCVEQELRQREGTCDEMTCVSGDACGDGADLQLTPIFGTL